MSPTSWMDIILDTSSPADAWHDVFNRLAEIAESCSSPVDLHRQTVQPDRLLAEAAWNLWMCYPDAAHRTSTQLKEWCAAASPVGRAVLVLDALSLREMPCILSGARARGIAVTDVRVTGAEAPSSTDQFARALGVSSRSDLANDGAPASFRLFPLKAYTDVVNVPFEDAASGIPHEPNVLVWHSWLDDLLHVQKKLPDQVFKLASTALQGDGFWKLVDRLRQGRKLVITSDHGYGLGKLFSSEVKDADIIEKLREAFGAARYKKLDRPWQGWSMPPIVVTHNEYHIVIGQRKWKVSGGFPHVCHGGLSLLEVAVPFIELPPL